MRKGIVFVAAKKTALISIRLQCLRPKYIVHNIYELRSNFKKWENLNFLQK